MLERCVLLSNVLIYFIELSSSPIIAQWIMIACRAHTFAEKAFSLLWILLKAFKSSTKDAKSTAHKFHCTIIMILLLRLWCGVCVVLCCAVSVSESLVVSLITYTVVRVYNSQTITLQLSNSALGERNRTKSIYTYTNEHDAHGFSWISM